MNSAVKLASVKALLVIAGFAALGLLLQFFVSAANTERHTSVLASDAQLSGGEAVFKSDPGAFSPQIIDFSGQPLPPPYDFSYDSYDFGPLSGEGNLASNGDWDWNLLQADQGTTRYQITIQSNIAIESDGYFFESGFTFSNVSHGGYIGLQTRTVGQSDKKGAIFSIWNATVGTSPSYSNKFTGEGEGFQTSIPFAWKENTEYLVVVEKNETLSTSFHNWWSGYVKEKDTSSKRSLIGSIQTPIAWGNLFPNNTFIERYGDENNQCGEFQPAEAEFTKYRVASDPADRPKSLKVEIRNYSDCGTVYEAEQLGDDGYRVRILPGN